MDKFLKKEKRDQQKLQLAMMELLSVERRKLEEMKRITVQEMDRHGIEVSALKNAMMAVVNDTKVMELNERTREEKDNAREELFRREKLDLQSTVLRLETEKRENEEERMRRMTREEELETKMNALNVEISKVKVEQETSLEALRQEHGLSVIKRREEKEREDSRYRELEEKTTKEQTRHQLQLQTWKKKRGGGARKAATT